MRTRRRLCVFAGFCAWWPGLLALLSFADNAVAYLVSGHQPATDPAQFSTWAPSHPHGINFANWAFFGVVVLALLGVEVTLNIGVEVRDLKAITWYLLWGSAVVVLAYLVTTWAVMVTLPAGGNQSVQITAVVDVVGRSLGPAWGQLAAVVLAGVTGFVLVVYNYSFARLVFISGLDRRLPALVDPAQPQPGAARRAVGPDRGRGRSDGARFHRAAHAEFQQSAGHPDPGVRRAVRGYELYPLWRGPQSGTAVA